MRSISGWHELHTSLLFYAYFLDAWFSAYVLIHNFLFAVKLPELLACINIEEEATIHLQQKLLDFLKYVFYLSQYVWCLCLLVVWEKQPMRDTCDGANTRLWEFSGNTTHFRDVQEVVLKKDQNKNTCVSLFPKLVETRTKTGIENDENAIKQCQKSCIYFALRYFCIADFLVVLLAHGIFFFPLRDNYMAV